MLLCGYIFTSILFAIYNIKSNDVACVYCADTGNVLWREKTLGYKIVFLANLDIPLCVYVYREFQGMPTEVLHRCY